MKKKNIIIVFVSFCIISLSCSKDAENQAPSSVQLVFPSQNLLCTDNPITFDWSEATDPENDDIKYNIIIAKDRDLADIVENRTITNSQLLVTLDKATPYYWKVNALDVNNNQGVSSETYAFITKGESTTNYAPFTSELLTPNNEAQVTAGSLNLTWNGADANTTDTLTYELYFGEGANLLLVDDSLTTNSNIVEVISGKTYSWKVNVKDQEGAKSIGQTWTFTVN